MRHGAAEEIASGERDKRDGVAFDDSIVRDGERIGDRDGVVEVAVGVGILDVGDDGIGCDAEEFGLEVGAPHRLRSIEDTAHGGIGLTLGGDRDGTR